MGSFQQGGNTQTYGKQRFNGETNMIYKFSSVEELLEDKEKLVEIIQHHQNLQRPRLKVLREYYKGNNEAILSEADGQRRREDHLADNRATHNFAKYVSQFIQGYMMGVPLKTSYPDESVDEQLRDINRDNDADEHNAELVLDQSIYGRAYEMVYRNNADQTRFITLDVLETFVVHDDSVEQNPIAAVRYIGKQFEDETKVFVYTAKEVYEFELDISGKLKGGDVPKPHYFQEIPIVEYENNKYRQGDFEDVLSLIDLYDAAQSDIANHTQDLNDALLLIKGNLDIDVEEAQNMKRHNLLFLQSEPGIDGKESSVDAKYIYKEYDVAGAEAYKDRLFNNILLFTSIPNLLDDKSSDSAQSGQALKFKLFALSQKRATKERLFKKSLRHRYRLINNITSVASEGSFDVNEIEIAFTENLPSMIDQELKWFTDAGGQLSNATLLSQLSFVENVDAEEEKMKEESEINADSYSFTNEEMNEEPDEEEN